MAAPCSESTTQCHHRPSMPWLPTASKHPSACQVQCSTRWSIPRTVQSALAAQPWPIALPAFGGPGVHAPRGQASARSASPLSPTTPSLVGPLVNAHSSQRAAQNSVPASVQGVERARPAPAGGGEGPPVGAGSPRKPRSQARGPASQRPRFIRSSSCCPIPARCAAPPAPPPTPRRRRRPP